jgi:hypothetical protein
MVWLIPASELSEIDFFSQHKFYLFEQEQKKKLMYLAVTNLAIILQAGGQN